MRENLNVLKLEVQQCSVFEKDFRKVREHRFTRFGNFLVIIIFEMLMILT